MQHTRLRLVSPCVCMALRPRDTICCHHLLCCARSLLIDVVSYKHAMVCLHHRSLKRQHTRRQCMYGGFDKAYSFWHGICTLMSAAVLSAATCSKKQSSPWQGVELSAGGTCEFVRALLFDDVILCRANLLSQSWSSLPMPAREIPLSRLLCYPSQKATLSRLACSACCAVLCSPAALPGPKGQSTQGEPFACCAVFSCSPAVLSFLDGNVVTLSLLCMLDIPLRYCCGNVSHGHPPQSQPALRVAVCYRKF